MPKSKEVKIALLGCGKLGQGLYKLWKERRAKIREKAGIDLDIIVYDEGGIWSKKYANEDYYHILRDENSDEEKYEICEDVSKENVNLLELRFQIAL